MKTRTKEIIAYQRSYWDCTMYDAIMAVADISDLDNDAKSRKSSTPF